MFKHILLPTDGSELAQNAAKAGVRFAKQLGARVTVYSAVDPLPANVFDGRAMISGEILENMRQEMRKRAESYVQEIVKEAQAEGVECDIEVDQPFAADHGIIEAAKRKQCDAIFMGSRGRTGVARMLLGSVASKVLAQAEVPVTIYR